MISRSAVIARAVSSTQRCFVQRRGISRGLSTRGDDAARAAALDAANKRIDEQRSKLPTIALGGITAALAGGAGYYQLVLLPAEMERMEREAAMRFKERPPWVVDDAEWNEGFVHAEAFSGPKPGMVWTTRTRGMGYYIDKPPVVARR